MVGEHVYIIFKPRIITLRMGSYTKLAPRFCGPFEILDKVGLVAYQLAMMSHIKVQNYFDISLLKEYVHDNSHIIYCNLI